jgi:calcineurin-like phosphoesterase family protein
LNIFTTSDHHFKQQSICEFTNYDGSKVRPWTDVDEMDEALIDNWNKVVKPFDKVYHLGDLAIKKTDLIERLNGKKVLIRGNHDIFDLKYYSKYFYDIRGCHVLDGCILTHIPIHPDCMARFGCNVHGHLHNNQIMKNNIIDPNYYCVSVERHNFTPISWEEVKINIVDRGGQIGFKNGIKTID